MDQAKTPITHSVILNYTETGCDVQPRTVKVRPGDKLRFAKGSGPKCAAVRVTFQEGKHFSAAVYNQGDPDVEVTSALSAKVTYLCELVEDGKVIAVADEVSGADESGSPGGAVEPASGDRGAS